jgi:hypothetical protein
MSGFAPSDMEHRCRAAHAWYCDLMRMRFDFRFVERQWFAALTAHDAQGIARAAKYVKRQVEEAGWDRNAALPANFLQADKLADYVSVSAPPSKFRLTDDERSLAEDFKALLGETVAKIEALPANPPPANWKARLIELYPNAVNYSDFFTLPDYIQAELRAESPALPALTN